MTYMLPRLRGWGESLSRQGGGAGGSGGGVGTRGPGETKIETDRRRIRNRKAKLAGEIKLMKTARDVKRQERNRHQIPSVAIAGYTNAGKSSLLNRLTGAGVLVENALFATLDPTVRKAQTPSGREFTFTDTVGFVRRLPHQLVEAFRSTLEEVADADLILHVVDGSHPDPEGQLQAVRAVFADIDAHTVPEVVVINKADLADPLVLGRLQRQEKHCLTVSAKTGEGLTELLDLLEREVPRHEKLVTVVLPYTDAPSGCARLADPLRGRGALRGAPRRGHPPRGPREARACRRARVLPGGLSPSAVLALDPRGSASGRRVLGRSGSPVDQGRACAKLRQRPRRELRPMKHSQETIDDTTAYGAAIRAGDLATATELARKVVPLSDRIGLTIVRHEPGLTVLTMELNDEVRGASAGTVHGGMLATLADIASATALDGSYVAGEQIPVTTDLHVRFYRQPKSGPLTATATLVHGGRTILTAECVVVDAEDRVLARTSASFMVVPVTG